jgi:hypothetical protein
MCDGVKDNLVRAQARISRARIKLARSAQTSSGLRRASRRGPQLASRWSRDLLTCCGVASEHVEKSVGRRGTGRQKAGRWRWAGGIKLGPLVARKVPAVEAVQETCIGAEIKRAE